MIHFLLLSILLLIVSGLLISWHRNVANMARLCDGILSVHLAADALCTDVHNAHTITYDEKGLHIGYPNIALVWRYDGNGLWRQRSMYEQGKWSKPFKSLLAKHINKSHFIAQSVPSVLQEMSLVTWHVNTLTLLFCPRNGLVI